MSPFSTSKFKGKINLATQNESVYTTQGVIRKVHQYQYLSIPTNFHHPMFVPRVLEVTGLLKVETTSAMDEN